MEFVISQHHKWPDCHETNSRYIDWILSRRCYHRIEPGRDFDLKFSRSVMEVALSLPKIWLPRYKKQMYRLDTRPHIYALVLTLVVTLISNFKWSSLRNGRVDWCETIMWPSPLTTRMAFLLNEGRLNDLLGSDHVWFHISALCLIIFSLNAMPSIWPNSLNFITIAFSTWSVPHGVLAIQSYVNYADTKYNNLSIWLISLVQLL